VLTTTARVFERQVRLVEPPTAAGRPAGSGVDRAEPEARTVADGSWRHADTETPAPALTLEVAPSLGTRFDLLIEEGDNAPLPLDAPHLLLPATRLRFFYPPHPQTPVTLLYGQAGLPAPRYDLALLAPQLLGEAAHEIALAPETRPTAPEPDPAAAGKKIFWGALVAAVVVLLLVLGRLLRGQPGEPAA
jgi:hypothetical protein